MFLGDNDNIADFPADNNDSLLFKFHCVKSAQIGRYFLSLFSCIRPDYGDSKQKWVEQKIRAQNMFK